MNYGLIVCFAVGSKVEKFQGNIVRVHYAPAYDSKRKVGLLFILLYIVCMVT